MDDGVVDAQFGRQSVVPDNAFLDDVDPLARLQSQWDILLHEQHGDILAVEHVDDLSDFGDHPAG